jgi:hypothetical protein
MHQSSVVFIGHQGINLPHGQTVPDLPKESAERCKSMIWQRYTLCEVGPRSGRRKSPLEPARKTSCADAPRLGVFSTASNTSPFILILRILNTCAKVLQSRVALGLKRVFHPQKTSFAFPASGQGLSTGWKGGVR